MLHKLTIQQRRIVELLAEGFNNKAIAGALFISEFTVKNHIHNIMRRLEAKDRTEVVARYYQNKIHHLLKELDEVNKEVDLLKRGRKYWS